MRKGVFDLPEEETKTEAVKLTENAEKVLQLIEKMNIVELNDLVKAMEEKFGISAVATTAAPQAATASGSAEEEQKEEKSAYNIVLESSGEQKIAVIKAVRAINPDLGLKEAKDLVEGAPQTVAENVPAEEAEKAKKALEEAGATVKLE